MDPINEFRKEVAGNIEAQGKDHDIQDLSMRWFLEAQRKRYSYNFSWLGRPIIQYPQDIVAMQELIWSRAARPDHRDRHRPRRLADLLAPRCSS